MHLALLLFQSQPDPEQAMKLMAMILPLMGIIILVVIAILMFPCWMICKKAGLSPWLALLCIVPSFGLIILLYILAFVDWKVKPVTAAQMGYPFPPPPQG
ncbi:MAG TPA: hypothetical protein VF392_04880 [Terracidiphilus sp.]